MKLLTSIFLLALAVVLPAQEVSEPTPQGVEMPTRPVWVGFSVRALAPEMRAHAPGVPEGIGFLVEKVYDDGPARLAGVHPYDIVWKLGDQLLVNEAQLATLLRLHQPGEAVQISVVRSGQHEVLDLTLAAMPEVGLERPISPMEVTLAPPGVRGMPKTVVYPQSSMAEVSREDGSTARLSKEEDGYHVVIRDARQSVIYEGPVAGEGASVPEEWTRSVEALIRGLQRSEDRDWSRRRPRPRVVPSLNEDRN
ncbi:hypothetical protein HNR46_002030 [Haloferula luteola]|uniref:PDZ domain-containing protein n=1 Tax=Haloferula luteola TaxID=595692 RepID=A0A840VG74_9BACT|nr:PDZ domain-containing protein [Haloferula luteola]MBB5351791.1 hypothetical protein [Haloferula luteola]